MFALKSGRFASDVTIERIDAMLKYHNNNTNILTGRKRPHWMRTSDSVSGFYLYEISFSFRWTLFILAFVVQMHT